MTPEPPTPDAIHELPPYAVLVFRDLDGDGHEEARDALNSIGRTDVLVVDLHGADLDSLSVLDQEQMAAAGWVRADRP